MKQGYDDDKVKKALETLLASPIIADLTGQEQMGLAAFWVAAMCVCWEGLTHEQFLEQFKGLAGHLVKINQQTLS